jgi:hypothetical protein
MAHLRHFATDPGWAKGPVDTRDVRSGLFGADERMTATAWREPIAGDVVWCHFRDEVTPRAKPRPALVLAVFGRAAAQAAPLGSRDA